MISRHGMSGCSEQVAWEIFRAASPITRSSRIAPLWCSRLSRKASRSRDWTKFRAFRAASNISRRSAASRSGTSAIDRLNVPEDRPTADVILAFLDCTAFHKINSPAEHSLKGMYEIEKRRHVLFRSSREGHEQIDVAAAGVKIHCTRRGTEHLQPRDAVPATDFGESVTSAKKIRMHRGMIPNSGGNASDASASLRSALVLFARQTPRGWVPFPHRNCVAARRG